MTDAKAIRDSMAAPERVGERRGALGRGGEVRRAAATTRPFAAAYLNGGSPERRLT